MEFDGRDLGTGTYVNLSIGLLLNVMWRLKGPWCLIVPNHPLHVWVPVSRHVYVTAVSGRARGAVSIYVENGI